MSEAHENIFSHSYFYHIYVSQLLTDIKLDVLKFCSNLQFKLEVYFTYSMMQDII